MEAVYNKNTHTLYMIAPRTGSSLLHDISCFVPDMVYISITQAFAILAQRPDTPIYITYRDPEIRFRSGLSVNLRQDIVDTPDGERPTLELISDYIRKIRYLDYCMSKQAAAEVNYHDMYPVIIRRPYHLYDQHLDHCLWRPFLLLLHGYNVKLLCISKWSEHIREHFAGCEDLIKQHQRTGSEQTAAPETAVLWDAYHSVFGKTLGTSTLDWDLWMMQEKLLYDALKKCNSRSSDVEKFLTPVLSELISTRVYFTDITTIVHRDIMQLVMQIDQHKGLNEHLKQYLLDIRLSLITAHQQLADTLL